MESSESSSVPSVSSPSAPRPRPRPRLPRRRRRRAAPSSSSESSESSSAAESVEDESSACAGASCAGPSSTSASASFLRPFLGRPDFPEGFLRPSAGSSSSSGAAAGVGAGVADGAWNIGAALNRGARPSAALPRREGASAAGAAAAARLSRSGVSASRTPASSSGGPADGAGSSGAGVDGVSGGAAAAGPEPCSPTPGVSWAGASAAMTCSAVARVTLDCALRISCPSSESVDSTCLLVLPTRRASAWTRNFSGRSSAVGPDTPDCPPVSPVGASSIDIELLRPRAPFDEGGRAGTLRSSPAALGCAARHILCR